MAASLIDNPSGVTIVAKNWFYDGWLYGVLGLPPRLFNDPDQPVRDVDIDSWTVGYTTARATHFDFTQVFLAECQLGRFRVGQEK